MMIAALNPRDIDAVVHSQTVILTLKLLITVV